MSVLVLVALILVAIVVVLPPVLRRLLRDTTPREDAALAESDAAARIARMEEAIIAMAGEIERLRAAQGGEGRYVSTGAESPPDSKPSQDDRTTA